jgi:hypothetical protein
VGFEKKMLNNVTLSFIEVMMCARKKGCQLPKDIRLLIFQNCVFKVPLVKLPGRRCEFTLNHPLVVSVSCEVETGVWSNRWHRRYGMGVSLCKMDSLILVEKDEAEKVFAMERRIFNAAAITHLDFRSILTQDTRDTEGNTFFLRKKTKLTDEAKMLYVCYKAIELRPSTSRPFVWRVDTEIRQSK